MKQLLILLILTSVSLVGCQASLTPTLEATVHPNTPEPTITHTPMPTSTLEPTTTPTPSITPVPEPQGMGPYDMIITKDGKYAFIDMSLPIAIFKVRLDDLSIEAVADLSAFFPSEEGSYIALDTSEKKLFVAADVQDKLIVIDTQTMRVIQTIDNIGVYGMTLSQYGPFLLTWGGGESVKMVNTETYEVSEFVATGEFFLKIQESGSSQDRWYVVSTKGPGSVEVNVGIYDHTTKTWINKISLPPEARADTVFDVKILPNEQKAYVAIFGGWYPEYHAYGWVHSIDLVSGEVKVVPIDGGAFHLEVSPDNRWVYVATGWPMPNTNNLLVVDTQSDEIVDQINFGKTQYGAPHTQMNDLQIDPAHPDLLYSTVGDSNALVKLDMKSNTVDNMKVFNHESFRPHFFVRRPGKSTGFVLLTHSPYAFELNLDQVTIERVVRFPDIRQDAGAYDVAINDTGEMLIVQGEYFLKVDADDMRLLGTYPLPLDTPSVWYFVISNNKKMIYTVTWGPEGFSNTFLAINASNFQVEATLRLEGGNFNFRPYELPDGSKLYALGGQQNGNLVINVIETDSYTIQKTITYDEPGMQGISAGPYFPYAYDANSHMLYMGTTQTILVIDTETDEIKKVIYLGDVARVIGLEPGQLTYINATGIVYNPVENYLYISHLDYSFVSIYDLNNNQFLPQVIPLKGFMPDSMYTNDDFSKIYCQFSRSDNISVIDVNQKLEEKLIDLHSYLPTP